MRSVLVVGVVLVLAVGTASSGVREDDHWLVSSCSCNVGGGGSPESRAWYVQLGVFHDRDRADELEAALNGRGLVATTYGAGWLTDANALADGPWVVVSRPYASRAYARSASRRYGRAVDGTLVRRFVTCPDEADEP